MNKINIYLALVILSSSSLVSVRAEDESNNGSELKAVVKTKAKRIKEDSEEIQKAFEKDFKKSTKVISAEAGKMKEQIKVVKEELKEHGKSLDESGKRMTKKLKDKTEELEELIEELQDL